MIRSANEKIPASSINSLACNILAVQLLVKATGIEELMKATDSETLDKNEMLQQKPNSTNGIRLLYLALNDLDGFKREVFESADVRCQKSPSSL